MNHQNLATLTQEEKTAMELSKCVCFTRHKCKGMSKIQRELYIKTLDNDLRTEIKRLTLLKVNS